MSGRSGPFWDAVEGRAPLPRAAATLGLELIDANPDAGTIELAFTGGDRDRHRHRRVIPLRDARAAA